MSVPIRLLTLTLLDNEMSVLTIAIPTYNRIEQVCALLESLTDLGDEIEVLVINDGEIDPFRKVHQLFSDKFKIIDNERNLGYAKNFCKIFENVATPYTMVMADDDFVEINSLPVILNQLKSLQSDFFSTIWLNKDGKIQRGRESAREIEAKEFRPAAAHAPGLIYNTGSVVELLPYILGRLDQGCYLTHTYPQVVYLMCLLLTGKSGMWLDIVAAREGFKMKSGIKDPSGEGYGSITSRLMQTVAVVQILSDFDKTSKSADILGSYFEYTNQIMVRFKDKF